MLTCQQLTELVTDYLEGRLSLREWIRFQMHLGMCRRCRVYLRQMKMTVKTLGKMPVDPIPADVRRELLARFHALHRREGPRATSASWIPGLLAAITNATGSTRGWAIAGAIVVFALSVVLTLRHQTGPLGDGAWCLFVEITSGGLLVGLLGALALTSHVRLAAVTCVVASMSGALAGFSILQATCDLSSIAPHVLVYHVGGIIMAGVLGSLGSYLSARQ